MIFSKKGQSLSMQTIVVAALALIVLAIVTLIFIGQINKTNDELNDCVKSGGSCEPYVQGRSCSDLINDQRWDDYGKYSVARDMRGQKCYNIITGEVDTNQMCCLLQ